MKTEAKMGVLTSQANEHQNDMLAVRASSSFLVPSAGI